MGFDTNSSKSPLLTIVANTAPAFTILSSLAAPAQRRKPVCRRTGERLRLRRASAHSGPHSKRRRTVIHDLADLSAIDGSGLNYSVTPSETHAHSLSPLIGLRHPGSEFPTERHYLPRK
jgi:hypothetical protein